MMSPEAAAAHERFCARVLAATQHLGRPIDRLAADAAGAYAAALEDVPVGEAAWRAFFQRIAILLRALERDASAPRDLIDELQALLHENEDLVTFAFA